MGIVALIASVEVSEAQFNASWVSKATLGR